MESLSRNFSQHLSPSALYSRVTTSRYRFHSHLPSFGLTKWPPNARSSRVLLANLLSTLFSLFLSQLTISLWSTKMRPNLLQFVALASAGVIKHKPGPDDIFSCGIPLPTFEDGTRAASWAQYLDETQAYLGQNGQGATDMFAGPTGRAPVRWPRNSDNKAVIPYCYQTEKVRKAALPIVSDGIRTWMS